MSDKKPPINEGYQPVKKGYQPPPQKPNPGQQQSTSQTRPNPPPKKP